MKRKEKNKTVNKNLIILIIVVLTFAVILILNSNKTNTPLSASPPNRVVDAGKQSKVYKSRDLKFSVNVPSMFQIEEKFTTASIKSIEGEILLSRVATDFENIEDYLNDLSVKNRIKITNRENVKINGLDGIRGKIDYAPTTNPTKYAYFVYADNWIYSLSTSFEVLFSDLDQIAQSFRYTP